MEPSENSVLNNDTISLEIPKNASNSSSEKYIDFEKLNNFFGDNICHMRESSFDESRRNLELERLSMKFEDLYSFVSISKPHIRNKSKTYLDFDKIVQKKNTEELINIDCRLSDLYQFKEDLSKFIKKIENNSAFNGKIFFANYRFDLRVTNRDSLFCSKNTILKEFGKSSFSSGYRSSLFPYQNSSFEEYFRLYEFDLKKAYENMKVDIFFSNATSVTLPKFVKSVQRVKLLKYRAEEELNIRELEWQVERFKAKKVNFTEKLRSLDTKEEELKKISRSISEQTVKNAKDREGLEDEMERLERLKFNSEMLFNSKIECINEALQMIENAKFEGFSAEAASPSPVPSSKLEADIKSLELELKLLEREFKTSKAPESLEVLQTNMNRVKNTLINLKSLNILQKNEKTSSALRNNLHKYDKLDNSTDSINSKHSIASNHSDSNLKINKISHRPLPAAIRISPLKKLEVSTSKVNIAELSTPTRRKNSLQNLNSPGIEQQTSKFLKVKEQLLREREEELDLQEKKMQLLWENVPKAHDALKVLHNEIDEHRKAKNELARVREHIEKEKNEIREKRKMLEEREKRVAEEKIELDSMKSAFEQVKGPVIEKLEWLKQKLIDNL